MKIGIVVAMDKEFICIKSLLNDICQTERNGHTLVTGKIGNNDIIMLQCGFVFVVKHTHHPFAS